MKLKDILEASGPGAISVIGAFGTVANTPDASRPTPVSNLSKWGKAHALLPNELCKDREWCEQQEKKRKKKKSKQLKDLEARTGKTL